MIMDLVKIATVVVALIVVYQVVVIGKRENMATAWFPYGYLDNIRKGISEGRGDETKENFDPLTYIKDTIFPEKKPELVTVKAFDPNEYHIGDYSQNELKPASIDKNKLEDIELGYLETSEFGTFEPSLTYADLLEVRPNDAGSGDMSELKAAYKNFNGNLYFNTLDMLNKRGGNAVISGN